MRRDGGALVRLDGHPRAGSARPRAAQHLCDARDVMLVVGSAAVAGERDGDRLVVRTRERNASPPRPSSTAPASTPTTCRRCSAARRFTIYPCRGEYAELTPAKRHLVNGPVYPLPHASGHGLGVHATKTTWGSVLLGPTIRFQDAQGRLRRRIACRSRTSSSRRASCCRSVNLSDLRLAGSGIRAKLHPPTESFADFMIRRDAQVPALVQVAGIDSPGLTSCLAIAGMSGASSRDSRQRSRRQST